MSATSEDLKKSTESDETAKSLSFYKKKNKLKEVGGLYRCLAVEVKDGVKKFGKKKVLNGIHMKATSGEIYAILGPSKAGKSTLLHTIVGIETLNQGQIEIFGVNREVKGCKTQIGYMPQRDTLFSTFTANEILRYFSLLMGLDSKYINNRVSFLCELLSLPVEQTAIRFLDENIRRRISLAVALLHEPQLLVLDEPTFGILPNLKEGIWDYLQTIATNENKTVIVTTADSKEAERAHRVGIMLSGKIVLENEPEVLLKRCKENDLESVYESVYDETLAFKKQFHTTFRSDEDNSTPTSASTPTSSTSTSDYSQRKNEGSLGFVIAIHEEHEELPAPPSSHVLRLRSLVKDYYKTVKSKANFRWLNPRYIALTFWKEVILWLKNTYWICATVLFPFFLALLAVLFLDGFPNKLHIGVLNHETNSSRNCTYSLISCKFLSYTNQREIEFHYDNFMEKFKKKGNLKLTAILVIPEGFSNKLTAYLEMLKYDNSTINIDLPNMKLVFKTTHNPDAMRVITALEKAKKDFFLNGDLDVNFKSDTFPFKEIQNNGFDCYGSCKISDDVILLSSYILLTGINYTVSYLSFIRIIVNRRIGLFNVYRVLGILPFEELISFILMTEILYILVTAIMFYFFLYFIGLHNQDIWAISILRLTSSWSYVISGMFIAFASRSVKVAVLIYTFYLLILNMFSLTFEKIYTLPIWMYQIFRWIPASSTPSVLKTIYLRKSTHSYINVHVEIVMPLVYGVISFILYLFLRRYFINDSKFK